MSSPEPSTITNEFVPAQPCEESEAAAELKMVIQYASCSWIFSIRTIFPHTSFQVLVRIVKVKQKGGIILKIKREKFLKEQIEISIQKEEKSYSEND